MNNIRINLSVFILVFFCCLHGMYVMAQTNSTPIMGWSSWNTYRININDSLIQRQTDAMVSSGLQKAGYNYINIDDGFFGYRDSTGILQTHHERFPNGLRGLVDYIHSKGLKAGIYSDAGCNTCGSIWDGDRNGIEVGLYGNEKNDIDLFFNQLDFDFIKIDYCGAGQLLNLDEEKRYTEICEAIRQYTTKNVTVNVCRWAFPGTWVMEQANSWRISPDIDPSWGSIKSIINKNLYLSAYARHGRFNDMDMLEMGRGLPANIEEIHMGMWCMMSSPLLIGCDLTTISPNSLTLLTNHELIALNQDKLARQAYVVQREGDVYVLVKDVEQLQGKKRAVALYNPSDEVKAFNIPITTFDMAGKIKVRDLILQKELKIKTNDAIAMEVAPRSAKFLLIEAEQRLEPVRYEAEWAYLNQFNDLGKDKRTVGYKFHPTASGQMIVTNLGGESDNYAQWDEVYSMNGGDYVMHINYVPFEQTQFEISGRKLEVYVNGKLTSIDIPLVADCMSQVSIPITLLAGNNTIRMGSSYTWAPDIDCFTLEKK